MKQLLHIVWMTDKRMYTRRNTHVPYHPSHRYIEYLTVSKHARLREDTFESFAKTSQFYHGEENEKRIKVRFAEIYIFQRIFQYFPKREREEKRARESIFLHFIFDLYKM